MRPLPVLGFAIVAGLAVSGCGHATVAAHKVTAVMPTPLTSTSTVTATAAAVAWTPVQVAQTQAAQLEAAEEQYATCFVYAGLDQGVTGDTVGARAPVMQSCLTTGLTSAEVQEIQDLIIEAP